METKEKSSLSKLFRTFSDLSLRNKDKQVIIRPQPQETSSSSSSNKDKELQIAEIENSLHNWSIPIVKKCEVYKQHKFWSNNQDQIHTVEYSYPGTKNNKTISLLSQEMLDQHIRDGYNFIHLGLIQVAAKPNYRIGVDSPILIMLRDIRLKKFNDSVIAILESNLHAGPAFFNCYPNFSMDIKNEKTSKALKLNIQTPEDIVDETSGPIQIIYRIYYKVTKIDYNYKALRSSPKDETILLEANLNRSLIQVPKRLSHDQIIRSIPEEWILEDIVEEPKIYNTQLREIIQEGSNIRLRMNRSSSLKIKEPQYVGQSSRHSIDGSTINLNLRGLEQITPIVSKPIYGETVKSESPEYSPTTSQVLNTLTLEEPFEIDKNWIKEDFIADYNKDKRDWYFKNYSKKQTEEFRKEFYNYMKENKINLYFFNWFPDYSKQNGLEYPFNKKLICPLDKINNTWKTIGNEIIESEYPPLQSITIQIKDLEIEASPYKDIKSEEKPIELKDIKKLHSQLNYSNTILEVMTKHLTRIENKTLNIASSSKIPEKPIYKLFNVPQPDLDNLRLKSNTDLIIDDLKEKINNITKSSINTLEINRVNRYPKLRNYYQRPTPADVQFEERGELVQNSFSGTDIVEWNLDGLSEQSILDLTCQMTMAATAHKTKGCSDRSAAIVIIQGFTGQLKGWWDNLCTEQDKLAILNCVKTKNNQEDAVSTLIYTIIQNFVGDPNIFKERSASQLANLYCPNMSDYRWYKDVFLSKITLREDRFAGFWKERFLAGLPKLFSEKVKINLEDHYGKPINYNILTYGQIHNIIIDTGIKVCTDFKLQNKLRKEGMINKKEIGSFCQQYGMEPLRAPSTKKKKIIRSQDKQRKPPYRKSYKKNYKNYNKTPVQKQEEYPKRKSKYKPSKNKRNSCWKCGKTGHYANNCKVIKKINALEDEKLRESLLNILINFESEELESESSEEELELEQINYNSTDDNIETESEDNCIGLGLCDCEKCTNKKEINMLSRDQTSTLISIIDKLENSPLRDEFITQLSNLVQRTEVTQKIEPISIK